MKQIFTLLFTIISASLLGQAKEAQLLGTWSDSSLPASFAHNNVYNEVWGLAVNDHEIAVIGTTFGTHFIDVTDPSNPTELFVVEGGTIGGSIIHRDFHDYNGYLYSIADEGSNTGLQIIDVTNLPTSIDVVYDSREYFSRSHNIFIDESKARLYSLISNGTAYGPSPMRIFDISNPIDPQPIASFNMIDGVQISQVHDAFVRNDTAYLNLGPSGFGIVDFSIIDTPNVITYLSPAEYPQPGYNHSGWPTSDGSYYYMADENFNNDMKVLDLRGLPDIDIPKVFNADSDDISIPHNQIVHGDKLYVSYYYDGLQVYDISDPADPKRELYYSTSSETPTNGLYRGAWGVYPFLPSGNILVSDMQEGLFVIDNEEAMATATQEVLANGITISPNPSNGDFKLDLSVFEGIEVLITITNNMGETLFRTSTKSNKLDVGDISEFTNGIYDVQCSGAGMVISKRLVVSK